MATKKTPAQPTAPTMTDAVAASAAEAEAERERLAAAANGAPSPSTEAEPKFEEWLEAQPKSLREKYREQVVQDYAIALTKHYGEDLSAVLEAANKDPEFLKWLHRLKDDGFRQFLRERATTVYDDPKYNAPTRENPSVETDDQFNKIVERVESDVTKKIENDRAIERYQTERRDELQALVNAHPELAYQKQDDASAKIVYSVITEAERRSQSDNRKIPYKEVYDEMREMWGKQKDDPPPRSAPRLQGPSEPPKPQAPRTPVEARAAINATLAKHGSLSALAAALRK